MRPGSTGCAAIPARGLLRPVVRGLPALKSSSLAWSLLQYRVDWKTGAPVQAFPRSVGLFASFPHVSQMHLEMPSSNTVTGVWFAEVSPLVTLVAARCIHFLRW